MIIGCRASVPAPDSQVAAEVWDVLERRGKLKHPPVTLAVRLVSVVDDCAQHAGQAGYVRGLLGATSR